MRSSEPSVITGSLTPPSAAMMMVTITYSLMLPSASTSVPLTQGLTLVQFSAQRKRFLWGRGCIQGLSRESEVGVRGY